MDVWAHKGQQDITRMEVHHELAAAPDGPATGATTGPMCVFVPYLVCIRAYLCVSMCVSVRIRAYPCVSPCVFVRILCVFWRIWCVFWRICYECVYGPLHVRPLRRDRDPPTYLPKSP